MKSDEHKNQEFIVDKLSSKTTRILIFQILAYLHAWMLIGIVAYTTSTTYVVYKCWILSHAC